MKNPRTNENKNPHAPPIIPIQRIVIGYGNVNPNYPYRQAVTTFEILKQVYTAAVLIILVKYSSWAKCQSENISQDVHLFCWNFLSYKEIAVLCSEKRIAHQKKRAPNQAAHKG